jgi:beta-carotene 3-hydroxylase
MVFRLKKGWEGWRWLRRKGYKGRMLRFFFIWLLTVAFMEGFAYVMHRWVMHGPGWVLHKSHHRSRSGRFELNDLYGAIFAIPSIVLIYGGTVAGWGDWATAVGVGIATYGAIYFGFHDVIVHKRVGHTYVPRSTYMKRIVQAHRMHHALESKKHGISFGFLVAPKVETLRRQLAESEARLRQPARVRPAESRDLPA